MGDNLCARETYVNRTMAKYEVLKVELLNYDAPDERCIKIYLSSGTVITAVPCYESWQQWGGTRDELYSSMPVVEQFNGWLHGF